MSCWSFWIVICNFGIDGMIFHIEGQGELLQGSSLESLSYVDEFL